MALPSLTTASFLSTQLTLTYSDGRQYFLNYRDINATQLDSTFGVSRVRIYLSGSLDESMSVTSTDVASLTAPNNTLAGFIATLNSYL
jgi:hypothetical protein